MSELKWTTENPTRAGWYWYRYGRSGRTIILSVSERDCVFYSTNLMVRHTEAQWSGPIPEPTESTPPHYIDKAVSNDLNQRIKND